MHSTGMVHVLRMQHLLQLLLGEWRKALRLTCTRNDSYAVAWYGAFPDYVARRHMLGVRAEIGIRST